MAIQRGSPVSKSVIMIHITLAKIYMITAYHCSVLPLQFWGKLHILFVASKYLSEHSQGMASRYLWRMFYTKYLSRELLAFDFLR